MKHSRCAPGPCPDLRHQGHCSKFLNVYQWNRMGTLCVASVQRYGLHSSLLCEAASYLLALLYSTVSVEDNYVYSWWTLAGYLWAMMNSAAANILARSFGYCMSTAVLNMNIEWNRRTNCGGNTSQFSKVKAPIFTLSATCEHSNCFTSLPTHVAPGLNFTHSPKCEVISYSSSNGCFPSD